MHIKDKGTLSVIIPVYQSEQYLKQCLDSVLSQTLEGMEIILIDDGSFDESAKICDEYAINDSRVIVIHKHNGGQSTARNVGLEMFTCPYLVFLDSDDYLVNKNVYRKLYNVQIDTNADMVISQYYVFNDGEEPEIIEDSNTGIIKTLSKTEFMDMIFEKIHTMYAFMISNKMHRAENFNNLRFENNNIVEDALIMTELVKKCSKAVCVEGRSMCYRIRVGSVSHTNNSKLFSDRLLFIKTMYDLAVQQNNQKYKMLAALHFEKWFFVGYYSIWRVLKRQSDDKEEKVWREQTLKNMRNWFWQIFPTMMNLKCKQGLNQRLCCLSFAISPYLFLAYNRVFKAFEL